MISETMLDVYRSILPKYGIPFDERRVLSTAVSFQSGDGIYNTFDQRGVMQDAQAVVCVHDVSAIGFCMALEARGMRSPEDMRICSVNCSGNSIAWSPSITGIDRMDGKAAELACELMDQMLAGKEVSQDNTYPGEVHYLTSCGCTASDTAHRANPGVFHRLVVNKVEAANQIGRMMQFNNALEDVESLAQLASNIHGMMLGIGCRSYFCCLNEDDLSYIESDSPETKDAGEAPYHDRMVVLSGDSGRTGELTGVSFDLKALVPAEPQAGDMFLLLPIHYINHSYGYMVFLNEMLPVDNYHYRNLPGQHRRQHRESAPADDPEKQYRRAGPAPYAGPAHRPQEPVCLQALPRRLYSFSGRLFRRGSRYRRAQDDQRPLWAPGWEQRDLHRRRGDS